MSYKSSFRFRRKTKRVHFPVNDKFRTNAFLNSLLFTNHFECSCFNQTVNLALYCVQKLHAILAPLHLGVALGHPEVSRMAERHIGANVGWLRVTQGRVDVLARR